MKKVRMGIIGVGNIGSAHAKAIYNGEVNGMVLSALCDNNEERIKKLKQQFPDCSVFCDYKELIKSGKTDAVIVSTPHNLHGEIGIFALENNLHILVEKPVDISVTVAKKLNETAEKSNKVFGIMFNQRTNSLFQKAREFVKSGKLGKLNRSLWIITNWYRTQSYYDSGSWRATWSGEGGGVLLNQAPHNLDLWQWICGMPKNVTAFCNEGKYHNIEVEDDVTIFAEYENGATGVFITSTGENPGTNMLEISGTSGKIVLENGKLKWWKLTESGADVSFSSKEMSPTIETEYIEIEDNAALGGHIKILQNFVDCILNNTPLLAPGIEGINELAISNAAYLSAWCDNKKIEIPFNNDEFDSKLLVKIKNSSYNNNEIRHMENAEYSSRWDVRW